jgi:hypothetical protein
LKHLKIKKITNYTSFELVSKNLRLIIVNSPHGWIWWMDDGCKDEWTGGWEGGPYLRVCLVQSKKLVKDGGNTRKLYEKWF